MGEKGKGVHCESKSLEFYRKKKRDACCESEKSGERSGLGVREELLGQLLKIWDLWGGKDV